jgi:hypothetical protein
MAASVEPSNVPYSDSIYSFLHKFRRLPTYQLERRVDALLLPFLEKIINESFNGGGAYKLVYAEFPLSTGSGQGLYACYADYMFYNHTTHHILFAELKTDCGSVSREQFNAYCTACSKKWQQHLDFFVEKAKTPGEYQKKFAYGLRHLNQEAEELVGCADYKPSDEMLKPGVKGLNQHLEEKTFCAVDDVTMSFIYIAPADAKDQLVKLQQQQLDNNRISAGTFQGLIAFSLLEKSLPKQLFDLLKDI